MQLHARTNKTALQVIVVVNESLNLTILHAKR